MKKNLILCLFMASILAMGVLLILHSPDGPNEKAGGQKNHKPFPAERPQNTIPILEVPLLQYAYQAGDHMISDFTYQTDLSIQQEGTKPSFFSLGISGELHQKVYRSNQDGAIFGYRVENPVVRLPQKGGEAFEIFKAALVQESYATANRFGKMEKFFFPSTVRVDLRHVVKSIILNAQIVLPQSRAQKWQSQEIDLNGEYCAQYTVLSSADMIHLQKKKLHYLKTEGKSAPRLLAGEMTIHFSPKGHFLRIEMDEELKHEAMGIVSQGKVTMKIVLKEKRTETDWNQEIVKKIDEGQFEGTTASQVEGEQEFERQRLVRILGNKTWDEFVKELEKLKRQDNPYGRYELFRQLVALMEIHPEKIQSVLEKIMESKEADLNTSTLLNALSKISHEGAQNGLSEIIQKRQEQHDILKIAIASLGGVERPNAKTVALLQTLHQSHPEKEIKDTASLALGSVAGQLFQQEPSQASAIVSDFERSLQNATSGQEKRLLLECIGNAGSSSSIPYVETCLRDPEETTRSTAAMAMRFIPEEKADSLLANALKIEGSLSVRNNILDAIGYRKPSRVAFVSLVEIISKENSEELRVKQAHLLWKMRKEFPEAEEIVKRCARGDASENVRTSVQNMMLTD